MTRIVVNDVDRHADATEKTWGDVLSALDRDLDGQGHVVTAARFDGVDTPTFRDQTALARVLAEVDCVEVDAGPPSMLLRRTLSEATGAVATLCDAAHRIGGDFRGHDLATANRELVSLAQSLGTLVTLVGVVGGVIRVDFDEFGANGAPATGLITKTRTQIEALIDAQQAEDWIAVADALEYEVSPALKNWSDLLDALRDRAEQGVPN